MMKMQGDLNDFLKQGFPLISVKRHLKDYQPHSDVKLDNFLYRTKKDGKIEIVISDLTSSIILNPTGKKIKKGYDKPYNHT